MAQDGFVTMNGIQGEGISPREIPSPPCGPVEGNPGPGCAYCREPLVKRGRGRPGKFHPVCRRTFDREARRIGARSLRRRLARARKPQAPRPRRAILRLPLGQYEDLRSFVAASAAWW
jgi:hypothetical protein